MLCWVLYREPVKRSGVKVPILAAVFCTHRPLYCSYRFVNQCKTEHNKPLEQNWKCFSILKINFRGTATDSSALKNSPVEHMYHRMAPKYYFCQHHHVELSFWQHSFSTTCPTTTILFLFIFHNSPPPPPPRQLLPPPPPPHHTVFPHLAGPI